MKLFAVTLYIEADDAVGACQAAGDLCAASEAELAWRAALEDGIRIRLATRSEVACFRFHESCRCD